MTQIPGNLGNLRHLRISSLFPDLAIGGALAVTNLLVIAPYLMSDLSAQPWNNDYILISMSRMFQAGSWMWNPTWYCGTPFGYIYPPLFHFIVVSLPVRSLGHAFHLASGVSYALVPVSLYVMGRTLFGSRLPAALAAVA